MIRLPWKTKTKPITFTDKEIKEFIIPHIEFLCRKEIDSLLIRRRKATNEYQRDKISKLLGVNYVSLHWAREVAAEFDICVSRGEDMNFIEDLSDMEAILNGGPN